jgi:predicted DNA-binding protein YlxM (UPF0122 family)
MMDQNAYVAWLLDFYGALLTPRQRFLLSQHVDEDFSVTEIARLEGISRQGVYDAVHTAQQQLLDYEARLGLLGRYFALRDAALQASRYLDAGDSLRAQAALKNVLDGEDESDGV